MNRPIFYTPALLDAALAAGQITQEQIDEAAFRVVHSYIRGGLFDHPLPAVPVEDASPPEHKAIARTIADQGTVLLKNDGLLPLQPAGGRHHRCHRPDRVQHADQRNQRPIGLQHAVALRLSADADLRGPGLPGERYHGAGHPGRRHGALQQR